MSKNSHSDGILRIKNICLCHSPSGAMGEEFKRRKRKRKEILKLKKRYNDKQKKRISRMKLLQKMRKKGLDGEDCSLDDTESECSSSSENSEDIEKGRMFLDFSKAQTFEGGDFPLHRKSTSSFPGKSKSISEATNVQFLDFAKGDVWALTVTGYWYDPNAIILVRSKWKGLHPRYRTIEVYPLTPGSFSKIVQLWENGTRQNLHLSEALMLGNFGNELTLIEYLFIFSMLVGTLGCIKNAAAEEATEESDGSPLPSSPSSAVASNTIETVACEAEDAMRISPLKKNCADLFLNCTYISPDDSVSTLSETLRIKSNGISSFQETKTLRLGKLSSVDIENELINVSNIVFLNAEQRSVLVAVSQWFRCCDERFPCNDEKPPRHYNILKESTDIQGISSQIEPESLFDGDYISEAISNNKTGEENELKSIPKASSSVILVHGVFGAGKSSLLSASIIFLCTLLSKAKIRSKVLLVCGTNCAVDGILEKLLASGFDDFVRIGRISEIKPMLLRFAVSSSKSREKAIQQFASAFATLKINSTDSMLLKMISMLEKDLKNGNFPPIAQKWKHARLIATTCSTASTSEVLNSLTKCCPFVFFDEASQIIEPLVVAVLLRFNALRYLLIGDPLQLPPPLKIPGPLSRSLLERLMERSDEVIFHPICLKTQYRCHPSISKVCNELFYGQQLLDGVKEYERPPFFNRWSSPLVCLLLRKSFEEKIGKSFQNRHEGDIIVDIIRVSMNENSGHHNNRNLNQIGIIALYKAQVLLIIQFLDMKFGKSIRSQIKVSTVDAFQGGEKDVIILSCVRSSFPCNRNSKIVDSSIYEEFCGCPRRLNVAISRARKQLLIVSNESFMRGHALWNHILNKSNVELRG
ncbi:hypothetical protein IE077_003310 [Cardiosporidium cionae]|uniref:Uncharacterized protein n=1 Tax=Cardiosporidium cionae TaxID=476202 RepID=A0ABQ7JF13_9APIC|nr:hypothetical protein IE077_003310 [Cardiosporidium cionae]|eukprot:KAF8822623.1 hypothetical protein IE077_003310 [Cardiosporidium cionae]